MTQIIDGKALAEKIKEQVKEQVSELADSCGKRPGLAVILVGDDPASRAYVTMKERDCENIGIESFDYRLDESTTQEKLEELITSLNNNPLIDGILVQMPLPAHLDEERVIELISPEKDVDGFHPENMGKLLRGLPALRACTPWGVIELLDEYGIDISGKHAVVIGRSNIVGKPQGVMLLERNATVTWCHSRTKNLAEVASSADILVAAIGRPLMLGPEYVKEGAVVIDVGINRYGDRLVGDVDYDAVFDKASFITPVPGGVGPMTRAILMKNTLQASLPRLLASK